MAPALDSIPCASIAMSTSIHAFNGTRFEASVDRFLTPQPRLIDLKAMHAPDPKSRKRKI